MILLRVKDGRFQCSNSLITRASLAAKTIGSVDFRHRCSNGERRHHTLKGDLLGIVKAIALSRAVMRNIRQDLFFAFVYNRWASCPIHRISLLADSST